MAAIQFSAACLLGACGAEQRQEPEGAFEAQAETDELEALEREQRHDESVLLAEAQQALLRPSSLTACSAQVDPGPYDTSDNGLGSPITRNALGGMAVRQSYGAGGSGTQNWTIRDQLNVNTRSESRITVQADIDVLSGWIEVWSAPPFGWADGGLGLSMRVVKGTDVMCSTSLDLGHVGTAGNIRVSPGNRSLLCSFDRTSNTVAAYNVEVIFTAFAGAGGIAGGHAEGKADLRRVTTTTCVEKGVLVDGFGQCVGLRLSATGGREPFLQDCLGLAEQKWQRTAANEIRPRLGLPDSCLTALGTGAGGVVELRPCSAALAALQRWTFAAGGRISLTSTPSACLDGRDGGRLGARVQIWPCLGPVASPPLAQKWLFQ